MGYTFYITPTNYDMAKQNGISEKLLTERVREYGWDIKRATTTPPRKQEPRKIWLEIARENNISPGAFYGRLNKGMSLEQASTVLVMDKNTMINNFAIAKRKYPKEYEEMALANGINKKTFVSRMSRGWSEVEAATKPVRNKPLTEERFREIVKGVIKILER